MFKSSVLPLCIDNRRDATPIALKIMLKKTKNDVRKAKKGSKNGAIY